MSIEDQIVGKEQELNNLVDDLSHLSKNQPQDTSLMEKKQAEGLKIMEDIRVLKAQASRPPSPLDNPEDLLEAINDFIVGRKSYDHVEKVSENYPPEIQEMIKTDFKHTANMHKIASSGNS